MELNALRPLIVPSSYFEHDNFPALQDRLVAPDLSLTWVELTDTDSMLYVTAEQAKALDAEDANWRSAALSAMKQADEGQVFTHEKRDDEDELVWVAMMHEDGLGSSRLLCHQELSEIFPEGYWIAIPDRSCGIAISQRLQDAPLDEMQGMVEDMYNNANIPMIPDLRAPAELQFYRN